MSGGEKRKATVENDQEEEEEEEQGDGRRPFLFFALCFVSADVVEPSA